MSNAAMRAKAIRNKFEGCPPAAAAIEKECGKGVGRRVLTTTDARNGATTYGYNNADQLTSVTPPPQKRKGVGQWY
jgi:YD repeat-containing protein